MPKPDENKMTEQDADDPFANLSLEDLQLEPVEEESAKAFALDKASATAATPTPSAQGKSVFHTDLREGKGKDRRIHEERRKSIRFEADRRSGGSRREDENPWDNEHANFDH